MGSWYWIGVAAGLGAAAGVAIGALVPQGRLGVTVGLAALLAVAAGVGGLLGAVASVLVVAGALRSGGTRLGLAVLVVVGGLGLAALAFVPALGYVEATLVPLLAVRASRRGSGRYAGLRILAKD
jgi:hypothetical protein